MTRPLHVHVLTRFRAPLIFNLFILAITNNEPEQQQDKALSISTGTATRKSNNQEMGKTKAAKSKLLDILGQAPKSKKELRNIVKATNPEIKSIKKALRKLKDERKIEKDGKRYYIASDKAKLNTTMKEDEPLPIAVQMRKTSSSQSDKKSVKFREPEVDLDEEIRRLEQELDDDSSSSDDSNSVDDDEEKEIGVLSLSQFADDHPDHLPKTCLPEPGRYSANAGAGITVGREKKQREEQNVSSGLKEAVKEVLSGYKARSSEKLPFYCRYCAKQYRNETEFFEHKGTEFHKVAVAEERKATYCRLCAKQLTSPAQMQEHLKSRPHKDRLQKVRDARRRDSNGRERDSKRQWC